MMKRVILHVSGKIQRAIYRRKVMSIAKTIGITGAIMNLLDGRMNIIGCRISNSGWMLVFVVCAV